MLPLLEKTSMIINLLQITETVCYKMMADVLKGTVDAPRSIEVPFTLIERDSVGGAPASE